MATLKPGFTCKDVLEQFNFRVACRPVVYELKGGRAQVTLYGDESWEFITDDGTRQVPIHGKDANYLKQLLLNRLS